MPGLTFYNNLPTTLRCFTLLCESSVIVTICSRLTPELFRDCVRLQARVTFVDVDNFTFRLRVRQNTVTVNVFSRRLYQAYGLCYRQFRIEIEKLFQEWDALETHGVPHPIPLAIRIEPFNCL